MFKLTLNSIEYTVKFNHLYSDGKPFATDCYITCNNVDSSEIVIGIGTATCSLKDMFSRAIGRKISLARALKDAGIRKEERKEFWDKYFSRK